MQQAVRAGPGSGHDPTSDDRRVEQRDFRENPGRATFARRGSPGSHSADSGSGEKPMAIKPLEDRVLVKPIPGSGVRRPASGASSCPRREGKSRARRGRRRRTRQTPPENSKLAEMSSRCRRRPGLPHGKYAGTEVEFKGRQDAHPPRGELLGGSRLTACSLDGENAAAATARICRGHCPGPRLPISGARYLGPDMAGNR